MKNVNEVIKKNVAKVDKVMKILLTPKINVLDKAIESIVRKYFVSINKSNLETIYNGIMKELNIKNLEDSKYFDIENLAKLIQEHKNDLKKKEQAKLLKDLASNESKE